MAEITTTPDGRTIPEPIKHDAPKHRCPICNHVCNPARRNQDRVTIDIRNGRPPVMSQRIYDYIKEVGTEKNPVSSLKIGEKFDLGPHSVIQYVYRARQAGYSIQSRRAKGYYIKNAGLTRISTL